MITLNYRRDAIPLYLQIKDLLEQQINDGVYKEGDTLPCERELQDLYGVSRVTVRQAIRELVSDDLVQPRRGVGTVIKSKKILDEHINSIKSFTTEMRERNMIPGLSKAEFLFEPASVPIAKLMNIDPKQDVCHLIRIRTGNNIPILYDDCYFPSSMKDLLQSNYLTTSLYELFEDNGIIIAHASDVFSASLASSEVAKELHIKNTSPVMVRTRTSYDSSDRIIEYSVLTYNSDLYSYSIDF